jgi:hypothetical protein
LEQACHYIVISHNPVKFIIEAEEHIKVPSTNP